MQRGFRLGRARKLVRESPVFQEPPQGPPPTAPKPSQKPKVKSRPTASGNRRGWRLRAPLTDRRRIELALDQLSIGLAPFVERRMRATYGKGWSSRTRGKVVNLRRALDTITGDNRAFDRRTRELAAQAREGQRRYGDNFGSSTLTREFTDSTLTLIVELLVLSEAHTQAAQVRRLLRGRRISAVAWLRSGRSRRPTPPTRYRKRRRRPSPLLNAFGCLALAGAVLGGCALLSYSLSQSAQSRYDKAAVGSVVATYSQIEVSSGYHLDLTADSMQPQPGDYTGDLAYADGTLTAYDRRLAPLAQHAKGGYAECRSNTRYTDSVTGHKNLADGRKYCVTTSRGAVALVTIKGHHDDPPPQSITIDLTIWHGPQPQS